MSERRPPRYSPTPGIITNEGHGNPEQNFSTMENTVFALEKIKREQWVFIELWAGQKQGVSAENQEKRRAVLRKIKEDFDTLNQAMASFGGGELTWQKLKNDEKFQNLVAELQQLLNIDSLKKYLEKKMAEQGQLEKETDEKNQDLFLPNEYIDPNEFGIEEIQKANELIRRKLDSFSYGKDKAAGIDEQALLDFDTLDKFLASPAALAAAERKGRVAELDLAWLKVNNPEVWHALCDLAKKDPRVIRLILGEPTVFDQGGLRSDQEHEQKRQEEIRGALPNIFNLAILRTAFKTESDNEREQINARELLKELYGDNIPEELNSGDMLALRAEISAALESIKDERIRKIVEQGYMILYSRLRKLKKIAEFKHWKEFFENIEKLNTQKQFDLFFRAVGLSGMVCKKAQAIIDGLNNTSVLAPLVGLAKIFVNGHQTRREQGEQIECLLSFQFGYLRRYWYSHPENGTKKLTNSEFLNYLKLLKNALSCSAAKYSFDNTRFTETNYLGDFTNLNLEEVDLDEADISHLDFSGSLFGDIGCVDRTSIFDRCNPEGAKFTGVDNLPPWIKLGLDETGTFHRATLQANLEKLSRERKEKEESGDYSDYPDIEHMELDEDGVYKESSLIAAGRNGFDLRGANLVNVDLTKIDISRADLEGAKIASSKFILQGMNLGELDWLKYAVDDKGIYKTEVLTENIKEGKVKKLKGVNLRDADLSDAGLNLIGVDFEGACLAGANFSGCDLSGVNLTEANLYRANFTGTNFKDCKLDRACVEGADFSESYTINLPTWITKGFDNNNNGKIFRKRQLAFAIIRYVSGESKKETTYYTSGADNIKFADLTQMKLGAYRFENGTKVEIMDMKTLSWKDTDLRGADLSELDGAFADIEGARFDKNTKMPAKNGNWIKYGLDENGCYRARLLIQALTRGIITENISGASLTECGFLRTPFHDDNGQVVDNRIIDGVHFAETHHLPQDIKDNLDAQGVFHIPN